MASYRNLRLRTRPAPAGVRRAFPRILVAVIPLLLAGAALAVSELATHSPVERTVTPHFLTNALGKPQSAAPLVRKPAPWLKVKLGSGNGYTVVHRGGGKLALTTDGAGQAGWSKFAHGVSRKTPFGRETITIIGDTTEQFLTVARRQGTHTWEWNLGTNLKPNLRLDGGIDFFSAGRAKPDLRILPPSILSAAGTVVTPSGTTWKLKQGKSGWRLQLDLNDSKLPVPYVIDPAVITFDATSSLGSTATVSSLTWSHTVANQWGRMLVVGVQAELASSNACQATSVTYNAVALTKISQATTAAPASYDCVSLWYLSSPATGAHNVVVTFPAAMDGGDAGAVGLWNVKAGAPDAFNSNFGLAPITPTSVTTVAANSWLVDIFGSGQALGNLAANAAQTQRWVKDGTATTSGGMSTMAAAAIGSASMTWSQTGINRFAHVVAAWQPGDITPPAGGAVTINGTAASGVGTTSYLNAGTTVTINSRTDYTETASGTASGLLSSVLTTQTATLTNGSCGAFGATTVIAGTTPQTVASGNCYQYVLTGTDNVGNVATITTIVKVDSSTPTAPTGVTFSALTNAFAVGTKVYFKGGGTGGFTVAGTGATDAQSGIAGYTYPALGTGWSNAAGVYTFGATAGTQTGSITAQNNAGLSSTGFNFTAQADSTAPAGGAFSANGTAATGPGSSSYITSGTTLTINSRTDYTEAQTATASGLASSTLTIQAATLTNNTCGAYGAPTTIVGTTAQTVADGNCYLLTLTGTDNVGNAAMLTTTVKVDTTKPTNVLTIGSPVAASFDAASSRLYYKGNGVGSFTFSDTMTDAASGPAQVTYPAIGTAGWTHNAQTVNTGPAYTSSTFSWTAAPSNPAGYSITGQDNAGNQQAAAITFVNDTTAPAGGAFSANSTAASGGGTTSYLTSGTTLTINSRTDYSEALSATASGLASSTLTIRSAALTNDACGGYGAPTTIVGTTSQTVAAGNCYLLTLTGTDNVGNVASLSTTVMYPGAATTLVLSGTPASVTAGNTGSVTVTAKDAAGNTSRGYIGTVHFTSTDGSAVLPSDYTFVGGDNGVHTFTNAYTLKTAGSRSLTATDTVTGSITGTSAGIMVNAGAFAKLQLLMPGETAAPGTGSGKTGSPSAQTAGTSFNVTVNAVDANWNLVNTVTDTAAITSSDANATLPGNAALVAGTKTFAVTAKTAGSATFTATDISDGSKTANTSPATTINAGAFTKLQLLMPGETAAPGSGTGKTGSPVGSDRRHQLQRDRERGRCELEPRQHRHRHRRDHRAPMPTRPCLPTRPWSRAPRPSPSPPRPPEAPPSPRPTSATAARPPNTSPATTINAGAFAKLQLLMPGETAAPGTGTGKTGSPSAQTAGTSFNVTVNAVDANWNLVNTVTDTAGITSSDANASLPGNAALVAGTKTFSVTAKTAGSATFTATDISDGSKTANTSPATTINAGAFTKLQLLMPGETAAPGTAPARPGRRALRPPAPAST